MRRLPSNSDLFAKRGDPWVSSKEGVKDYGRNPDTEDAEYDFDRRFHQTGETFGKPKMAVPKVETREPRPKPSTEPDYSRRKANILIAMNRKLRAQRPIKVKDNSDVRVPCPFCSFSSFDSRAVSAHLRTEHRRRG